MNHERSVVVVGRTLFQVSTARILPYGQTVENPTHRTRRKGKKKIKVLTVRTFLQVRTGRKLRITGAAHGARIVSNSRHQVKAPERHGRFRLFWLFQRALKGIKKPSEAGPHPAPDFRRLVPTPSEAGPHQAPDFRRLVPTPSEAGPHPAPDFRRLVPTPSEAGPHPPKRQKKEKRSHGENVSLGADGAETPYHRSRARRAYCTISESAFQGPLTSS